LRKGNRGI